MVRRFARPYARAILDVAGSAEKANTVRAELAKFEQARRASTELQELYANPGIGVDSKMNVTHAVASRLSLGQLTGKVLETLIRNRRINDLGGIVDGLAHYINEELDIAVADVKTAQKLSEQETADLRRTLEKKTGKRVEVRLSEEPSLMGGLVVRIGSEIWDASVAGKINRFRESLT
ncbi:MAG TPA: ATP synthase F1 subunit delta [Thermoanaerobaculia bacterium]|nr:ATP synthase F1 subunit delta [Thermoanaerobaculia bacterium]